MGVDVGVGSVLGTGVVLTEEPGVAFPGGATVGGVWFEGVAFDVGEGMGVAVTFAEGGEVGSAVGVDVGVGVGSECGTSLGGRDVDVGVG